MADSVYIRSRGCGCKSRPMQFLLTTAAARSRSTNVVCLISPWCLEHWGMVGLPGSPMGMVLCEDA